MAAAAAATIANAGLAHLIENRQEYMEILYRQWEAIEAAPEEIKEVGRQVNALYLCLGQLLESVATDGSIINSAGRENKEQMEKFLRGCTDKMDVLLDMMQHYTVTLPNGRRTWTELFQKLYKSFSWTQKRGKIEDLVHSIKDDIEMTTKISIAIQNKALNVLQSTLTQLSAETVYIRRDLEEIKNGLQMVYDLLLGIIHGHRGSLHEMFSANKTSNNQQHANLSLPSHYPDSGRTHSQSAPSDRFRKAGSEDWQIIPHNEPSILPVTTAGFLWRLAKVASDVHPWDNKIRSSERYKNGTCEKALYNVVCNLMKISESQMRWSAISLASWLTAGAWYLSLARFQLHSVSANKRGGSPVVIYVSFIKAFWIVITLDQHPQKPTRQDVGQTYREWEQYENLVAALHIEIENAEEVLGRDSLQSITSALQAHMGKIWERESEAESLVSDHIIGSYASRILESANGNKSFKQPSATSSLGQWDPLCEKTVITLPRVHEHVPQKPTVFACMCDQSQHLLLLKQFYVAEDSFAIDMNSTSLELHSLRTDRNENEKVILAIDCQTQAARDNLRNQLQHVTRRLQLLGTVEGSWKISSLRGDPSLRLTRSAFDNGKIGSPFIKALSSSQTDSEQTTETYIYEEIQVPRSGGLQSVFWSLLGYQPEKETVMRKKKVVLETQERPILPDERLTKTSLAISPLTISLYHHWSSSLKSTIRIANPTSCFELFFDLEAAVLLDRLPESSAALRLTFSPGVHRDFMAHNSPLEMTINFQDLKDLASFQCRILLAKAFKNFQYLDRKVASGLRLSHGSQEILWRGKVRSFGNSAVSESPQIPGERSLMLLGKAGKSIANWGMVWTTSNFGEALLFKCHPMQVKPIVIPSVARPTVIRLLISESKVVGDDTATDPVLPVSRRIEGPSDKSGPNDLSATSTKRKLVGSRSKGGKASNLSSTEMEIEFFSAEDANAVQILCEGLKIHLRCTLRFLEFAPAKKLGIHTSSKSQPPSRFNKVVIEIIEGALGSQSGSGRIRLWVFETREDGSDGYRILIYLYSNTPRSTIKSKSKSVYLYKLEVFPASANGTDVAPAPEKNQSTATLRWKGDFELRFVNREDAERVTRVLLGGSINSKSAEDIEIVEVGMT